LLVSENARPYLWTVIRELLVRILSAERGKYYHSMSGKMVMARLGFPATRYNSIYGQMKMTEGSIEKGCKISLWV
jgi:hypothetical protein